MVFRRRPNSPTRTIILPAPFLSASDFNESKVFGPPLFCPFRPSLSPLFSCNSKLPILQPLCFDNHANCRGVGGTPYLDFILGGNGSEKQNKRAGHARSNRSEWHPALVGEGNVTACLPRGWRGSGGSGVSSSR